MQTELKKCATCGLVLPLSDFTPVSISGITPRVPKQCDKCSSQKCTKCNRQLPLRFFKSYTKKGRGVISKVCVECRQPDTRQCIVCGKEQTLDKFKGSQFAGDPYTNSTTICASCRNGFELVKQMFVKTQRPVCSFCGETKKHSDFSMLDDKMSRLQGLVSVNLTKACNACRRTDLFNKFILYMKRVVIKESKKKNQKH